MMRVSRTIIRQSGERAITAGLSELRYSQGKDRKNVSYNCFFQRLKHENPNPPRITYSLKILDPEASLKPDTGKRNAPQKILDESGKADGWMRNMT